MLVIVKKFILTSQAAALLRQKTGKSHWDALTLSTMISSSSIRKMHIINPGQRTFG